ncbi:MAG: preprotein translocase subunit SecG [Anaerolineae bacterium]
MITAINIIQIIISITLVGILLIQMKGEGLGGIFGGDSSVYHQRRGLEATLFNITIGLSAFFLIFSLFSALAPNIFK